MATLVELKTAMVNAHNAGDADAARRLAQVINEYQSQPGNDIVNNIPGMENAIVPGTVPQPPEPTLPEKAVGAGEAALSTVTGATGGAMGFIGGTLKGIADEILSGKFGTQEAVKRIEEQATKGASALTYAPRTETGQQYTEAVGKVGEALTPLAPMAGELTPAIVAAREAAPIARAATETAAAPTAQAVERGTARVRQMLPGGAAEIPTAGTAPSVGAAGVDIGTIRQAQAGELPVPIKLTEGQKTRTFEQQRFERETAKLPEEGAPLRERFTQQNAQLQQNMDAFIDSTGAKLTDTRGIGELVDKALKERAAKDKVKIRALYKKAETAGEMQAPVKLDSVINVLNESRSAESTAPILTAAKKELIRLGGAVEDANGDLIPAQLPMTLQNTEQLRKFINKVTGTDATNIKFAGDLKRSIDTSTEGLGGEMYKRARAARARYAQEYENIGLAKQLLNTKRGTNDRAIAMENVLNKTVLSPSTSLDEMRHVRRLLQTKSGEVGKQAWRELQGGTLRHIQDQMTKGISRDQAGNAVVSPAQLDRIITQLDASGKLDFIFGKKGAEQLRTINEVAKDVLTAPPGAVNTSNTASVLAGLMDVAISGTAGVPVPIMSSFRLLARSVKNAKLKARIKKSLGE